MSRPMVTKCDHTDILAYSRGMCKKCYYARRKNLTQEEFERLYPSVRKPQQTHNSIANVYEDLAEIGVTKSEVARKLGITQSALELALKRKQKEKEDKLVANFLAEVDALDAESGANH